MLEVRPPRRAVGSSRGATHAHPRAERGEEAAQRADAEVADEGVPGVRRAGHAGLRRQLLVLPGQGATDAEIAETLDIGLLMGGTLAAKSVRHAFAVLDELKTARGR